MRSNQAEPPPIATQLVLLFTLATALLLSASLGIFYWMVVRHTFAEDNAVLADKALAVVAELQRTGSKSDVTEQVQPRRTAKPPFLYVRILDGTRKVVAETPNMATLAPPDSFSPARAVDPEASGARRYLHGGQLFYLLTTTVSVHGVTYTVQAFARIDPKTKNSADNSRSSF